MADPDKTLGCGLVAGCGGCAVIILLSGLGVVAILFAAAYKLVC